MSAGRPVIVLHPPVPEHAQSLSAVWAILGTGYVTGRIPLPMTVLAWADWAWLAYGWAILFGASGLFVLVAAWAPRRWMTGLTRLSVERGGQYMQAGACFYLAASVAATGLRAILGTVAFGAWGLASLVRAVRIGRSRRAIRKAAGRMDRNA